MEKTEGYQTYGAEYEPHRDFSHPTKAGLSDRRRLWVGRPVSVPILRVVRSIRIGSANPQINCSASISP